MRFDNEEGVGTPWIDVMQNVFKFNSPKVDQKLIERLQEEKEAYLMMKFGNKLCMRKRVVKQPESGKVK